MSLKHLAIIALLALSPTFCLPVFAQTEGTTAPMTNASEASHGHGQLPVVSQAVKTTNQAVGVAGVAVASSVSPTPNALASSGGGGGH